MINSLKKNLAIFVSAVMLVSTTNTVSAFASTVSNDGGTGKTAESFTNSQYSHISKAELLKNTNDSVFGLAGNFNAFIKNDFTMTGSDEEGRLAAGGNVTLIGNGVGAELPLNTNKSASLIVGGNYVGKNTPIAHGFAIVNGKVNSAKWNVSKYKKFYSYPGLVNFDKEFKTLTALSDNINSAAQGAIGSNVGISNPANISQNIDGSIGTVTSNSGDLKFVGTNPTYNIFNINASELNGDVHTIHFNVPKGAAIIVNVIGKKVEFPKCGWFLNGNGLDGHHSGGEPNRLMWNLPSVTNVSADGSVEGSVLGPNANWVQPDKGHAGGDLDGNMIVKSFYSKYGFEMHDYFFTGKNAGRIRLTKTSIGQYANTPIIQGFTFSLYINKGTKDKPEWKLLETRTPSQAGDINFINLQDGQYKIVEDKAPTGNQKLKHPIYLTLPLENSDSIPMVDNSSNHMIISAKNTSNIPGKGYMGSALNIGNYSNYVSIGKIQITKTNEDGLKFLPGAEFTITDSTGKLVGEYTTNKDGVIETSLLKAGTYTIKEIKPPKGYTISKPDTQTIKVDGVVTQGVLPIPVTKVSFKDQKSILGSLTISKNVMSNGKLVMDSKGKAELLGGVVFDITGPNNYKNTITTKQGEAFVINNLELGSYTVTEKSAPTGYEVDSKAQTIVIDAKNATTVKLKPFTDTQ
uniref:choice-of-anchor A family protein n=1 Tax=uncultured Clostridium sp. TaxID=59620 RepID=UPI0026246364